MEAPWGDGGGDAVEQGGQTAARWMSAEWGDLIFYIFFYFWVRTAGRPSMSIIGFYLDVIVLIRTFNFGWHQETCENMSLHT
jgi:hypothetical protein